MQDKLPQWLSPYETPPVGCVTVILTSSDLLPCEHLSASKMIISDLPSAWAKMVLREVARTQGLMGLASRLGLSSAASVSPPPPPRVPSSDWISCVLLLRSLLTWKLCSLCGPCAWRRSRSPPGSPGSASCQHPSLLLNNTPS